MFSDWFNSRRRARHGITASQKLMNKKTKLLLLMAFIGTSIALSLSLLEVKPYSVEASVAIPSSATYEHQKTFLLESTNSRFRISAYQDVQNLYVTYGSISAPKIISLPKCIDEGSEQLNFKIEVKRFSQDLIEASNSCSKKVNYLDLNLKFIRTVLNQSSCSSCVSDKFVILERARALSFFGETEIRAGIQFLLCIAAIIFFAALYRNFRNHLGTDTGLHVRYITLGLLLIIAMASTIPKSPPARDLQVTKVSILKDINFQDSIFGIEVPGGSIPKGNVETFLAKGQIYIDSKYSRPMYRESQKLFAYGFISGEIDQLGDLIIYVNRGSDGHNSIFAKGSLSPGIHHISISVKASREVLVAVDGKSYIAAYADRPVFWGSNDSAHRANSSPSTYRVNLSKSETLTGFSEVQIELRNSSERLASLSYAVNRLGMYLIFLMVFSMSALALIPILGLRRERRRD